MGGPRILERGRTGRNEPRALGSARAVAGTGTPSRSSHRSTVGTAGSRIGFDVVPAIGRSDGPRLQVPHPASWYRRFVLDPLAVIAGNVPHPTKARTVAELRERLLRRPLRLSLAGGSHSARERLRRILAGPGIEIGPWAGQRGQTETSEDPELLAWLGPSDEEPELQLSSLPAFAATRRFGHDRSGWVLAQRVALGPGLNRESDDKKVVHVRDRHGVPDGRRLSGFQKPDVGDTQVRGPGRSKGGSASWAAQIVATWWGITCRSSNSTSPMPCSVRVSV